MRFLLILFLLLTHSLAVVPLAAEDLQVTDYLGLIRAQRSINAKATVTITVRRSEEESMLENTAPLLTQRTGIALDIESVQRSSLEYRFENVPPGIWRIRLRNKGLVLDSVVIEEQLF